MHVFIVSWYGYVLRVIRFGANIKSRRNETALEVCQRQSAYSEHPPHCCPSIESCRRDRYESAPPDTGIGETINQPVASFSRPMFS